MNTFSDPQKIVREVGIVPGMVVADFGAGAGAYTLAAAKVLQGKGKVYAVEVQKELVTAVSRAAQEQHLGIIEVVWGDIEHEKGSKLREGIVDVVFICNVLFQATEKKGIAREAMRILKYGGCAVIIDWAGSFGGVGPQAGQLVRLDEARRIFESERFVYDKPIFDAGAHHYGFIMKKQ
ncbi:MAG: class I SAM-dependent methyltransferase [Minisyncoccota bacterium]